MVQQRLKSSGCSLIVCLFLIVWPFVALAHEASDETEKAGVIIHEVPVSGGTVLVVENTKAYDVTVSLFVHSRNTRLIRYRAETDTYPGGSKTQALLLYQDEQGKPWSWRYRLRWIKGDIHAVHDDTVLYRLPFERNKSYRVTQTYHGRFSHEGVNEYSVDFAMREGSHVCAARAGVVVEIQDQYTEGGTDETYKSRANYVTIAHADGTFGEYHHLKHLGVLVEVGQRVVAGEVIGLSGNTGYSSLPHLHFGVYSPKDSQTLQSHPVTFITSQGAVREPVVRRHYTVP